MDRTFVFLVALTAFVVLLPAPARAQDTGIVTGVVFDAKSGETIPGANVTIPELQRGAATNADGVYRIAGVPAGTYDVVARFVGYRTARQSATVASGEETNVPFELREDLLELDEVVVTGQGTQIEKRKLSATVDVISASDIEEAPVSSIDQLLQGRVAGASIRTQSAQPGQGMLMNFRGITSVVSSQTPVIYVDGIRVDNSSETSISLGGETTSALSELLVNDIERIEVTKGGAASTLYGSDAANGVIQIFTKTGSPGAPRVTFRTEQGFDLPVSRYFKDTQFSFPNLESNFIEDEFLKTGYFQNYYTGVSGGSDALTYNVSGRVQNSTGVQPDNESTLYALRGVVTSQLTNQVNVRFSGAYTRNNFQRLNNGVNIADPLTALEVGDALFFTGAETLDEALDTFLLQNVTEGVDRFTVSATADYAPSDLFSSSLTAGIDSRVNQQRIIYPSGFDIVSGDDGGSVTRFDRNFKSVTLDYRGTISYPREGEVTSDLTFGVQGFRDEVTTIESRGETLVSGTENFGEAGTVTSEEDLREVFNGGFYVRETLGWRDVLFVNAGIRFDGNSAFGEEIGLQAYPNVGVAYTISDEDFWGGPVAELFSEVKLRTAYGVTGSFPDPFARDFTFESNPFRGEAAPRFDNPGNDNLKPERTSTIEGGVELALLNDRVALSGTVYREFTQDALFNVPEQPVTGQFEQLRNVGEIVNVGTEVSLDARLLTTDTFTWSMGANWGWLATNELTDIGDVEAFQLGGREAAAQTRIAEGRSIGAWYARTPFDSNGDGLLDASEFRYTGKTPYPKHTGAVTTQVGLFNLVRLSAMADWATGAQVFDWGSHWASFNGLVRAPRPTRFTLDGEEDGLFSTTTAGSFLLQNGNYLKLREVSINVAIPRAYLDAYGIQSASVFVTGRNLLDWTATTLVDPELAGVGDGAAGTGNAGLQLGGEQSITLSPPRQFRIGLQVTL